jgi:putative phosphoserine phosphatase/1-acylglycerol-3-phosphate O-acyltransferase
VDVRVLPPVETSGWTTETMDAHVAEVRQLFVEELERWPLARPAVAAVR